MKTYRAMWLSAGPYLVTIFFHLFPFHNWEKHQARNAREALQHLENTKKVLYNWLQSTNIWAQRTRFSARWNRYSCTFSLLPGLMEILIDEFSLKLQNKIF